MDSSYDIFMIKDNTIELEVGSLVAYIRDEFLTPCESLGVILEVDKTANSFLVFWSHVIFSGHSRFNKKNKYIWMSAKELLRVA